MNTQHITLFVLFLCILNVWACPCSSCEECINGVCQPLPDGTPCLGYFKPCYNNSCYFGTCTPFAFLCDDNNPCTCDFCSPYTGYCYHNPFSCDTGDVCNPGYCNPDCTCSTTPIVCTIGYSLQAPSYSIQEGNLEPNFILFNLSFNGTSPQNYDAFNFDFFSGLSAFGSYVVGTTTRTNSYTTAIVYTKPNLYIDNSRTFSVYLTSTGTATATYVPTSIDYYFVNIIDDDLNNYVNNDFYVAYCTNTLIISAAAGVLANDYQNGGTAGSITSYTNPSMGTLSFTLSTGEFSYTANNCVQDLDSFTYTYSLNGVDSVATVTIYTYPCTINYVSMSQSPVQNEGFVIPANSFIPIKFTYSVLIASNYILPIDVVHFRIYDANGIIVFSSPLISVPTTGTYSFSYYPGNYLQSYLGQILYARVESVSFSLYAYPSSFLVALDPLATCQ